MGYRFNGGQQQTESCHYYAGHQERITYGYHYLLGAQDKQCYLYQYHRRRDQYRDGEPARHGAHIYVGVYFNDLFGHSGDPDRQRRRQRLRRTL